MRELESRFDSDEVRARDYLQFDDDAERMR